LTGTDVFIGAGTNDPICLQQETLELQKMLMDAGASVTIHWENDGHQLTITEVEKAKEWYEKHYS